MNKQVKIVLSVLAAAAVLCVWYVTFKQNLITAAPVPADQGSTSDQSTTPPSTTVTEPPATTPSQPTMPATVPTTPNQPQTTPSAPATTSVDTTGWKTYHDSQVTFKYPAALSTTYLSLSQPQWPPSVSITKDAFSCTTANQHTVGSRTYCVTRSDDGAAGSTYSTFTYKTSMNSSLVTMSFVIRYPECGNYGDGPKVQQCQTEENTFSVDQLADQMVSTIQLPS